MATYMIGFDLNKEGKNYSARHEALTGRIKELFGTFWRHLDSTWLVKTQMSAKDIRDDLSTFLDEDDELLVAGMSGEGAWHGFKQSGSKWLTDHL
ncbi:SinR family protein [Sinorhizobium medicae]|uniref:SinR family protein n=1 Tax=Sinorhizobium medicae TaxID=110321 RepID=UPI0012975951|nr:SinR family protein [Sinorhizobium medicae]MQX74690.1 SinR family protein [Sinorhizobium medicae]